MDLRPPSFARRRVPAVVGALAAGGVILVLGNIPWGVLFTLNQRLWPAIPWSVPPAILCLAGVWWYLLGGGTPAATRTWRSESLRAPRGLHASECWPGSRPRWEQSPPARPRLRRRSLPRRSRSSRSR